MKPRKTSVWKGGKRASMPGVNYVFITFTMVGFLSGCDETAYRYESFKIQASILGSDICSSHSKGVSLPSHEPNCMSLSLRNNGQSPMSPLCY